MTAKKQYMYLCLMVLKQAVYMPGNFWHYGLGPVIFADTTIHGAGMLQGLKYQTVCETHLRWNYYCSFIQINTDIRFC